MDPLNKAERNASILNFIAIYIIVIALPVFITFLLARNYNKAAGSGPALKEQIALAKALDDIQKYVAQMAEIDTKRPQETESVEAWRGWIQAAELQNNTFFQEVTRLRNAPGFTEARLTIRNNTCSFLDRVHTERVNYLDKRKVLLDERGKSNDVSALKAENTQLKMANTGLQNSINTQNALLAQAKPAGGGGGRGEGSGGQQNAQEINDLKLQMRFIDANCKKTRADEQRDVPKRKQLYTTAKADFRDIVQKARSNYVLQESAKEKLQEIDRMLARL